MNPMLNKLKKYLVVFVALMLVAGMVPPAVFAGNDSDDGEGQAFSLEVSFDFIAVNGEESPGLSNIYVELKDEEIGRAHV